MSAGREADRVAVMSSELPLTEPGP